MGVIWQKTDKVVVGVSGGIDSVVLLHAIVQQVDKQNIVVVHVNHGMRETASRDCFFVNRLAQNYGVIFETNEKFPQLVNENDARVFRYAFLEEVAKRYGAKYVLTAHHKDDQVETFLWRLMRGDGVNGLLGIPKERLLNEQIILYRPLLDWSKTEIIDYAKAHHLEYVEDETNEQLIYTRNRLRHTVLPLFRQEQERFDAHVVNVQNELTDMLMHLDETLLQVPYIVEGKLQLTEFRKLSAHTQRVLLSRWLIKESQPTRYVDSILTVAKQSDGQKQLSLNGGFLYMQTYDVGQIILPADITPPQNKIVRQFPYTINGYELVLQEDGIEIDEEELPLIIRSVESGDKLALNVGHKKVSRILIDAKIPKWQHGGVLVLATSQNRVITILDKRCENLSKPQETGKINKYNQIIITIRKAAKK